MRKVFIGRSFQLVLDQRTREAMTTYSSKSMQGKSMHSLTTCSHVRLACGMKLKLMSVGGGFCCAVGTEAADLKFIFPVDSWAGLFY
jgi:hypothetical protein